jgi:protein phosphatase
MSFLAKFFARAGDPTQGASDTPTTDELAMRSIRGGRALELRIEAGLATDPGCVRSNNEDFARIIRPTTPEERERQGLLAVVCDGMGGHEGGEIASRLAVETIVRRLEGDAASSDPMSALPRALQAANRAVYDCAAENERLKGMGTTCAAVVLRDGVAYGAHVGDSRVYLIRNGDIFLMTEDHSAVMDLVRRGVITREDARHHPDKNVINRALGSRRDVEVSAWPHPFTLLPGDTFLLCSDGLYDLVGDDVLLECALNTHPQVACDRLITRARDAGGYDNITVAILTMSAANEPAPNAARETRSLEIQP